jgi:hypothetical protein
VVNEPRSVHRCIVVRLFVPHCANNDSAGFHREASRIRKRLEALSKAMEFIGMEAAFLPVLRAAFCIGLRF